MIVNNYTDLGIVSGKIPVNTHLWIEVNSAGSFYFVATGDLTHLWYSDDKMDTESKIDIDPGDAWGGDTDHRPANIISAWHDCSNKIIYFTDHSGGNTIYAWKLDYSASESGPSITEIGTVAGLAVVGDVDIFMIGADIFMWYVDTAELTVVKWVDPNWVNQDTALSTSHPLSYIVVVGTIAYILLDADPVILFSYTNGTTTMASIETFIGKSLPGPDNLLGITYDDSNILDFILNLDADGKNYLYSYNISGDSQTQLGEYNISLMLDRNTVSGILEKAFHITSTNIYQLHSSLPYQLHLIASPPSDAVWIAITDNFLMNADGDMYEYQDVEAYVMEAIINMKKMGAWLATISILNTYPLVQGMFITITDMFTTAGVSASQIIFEGFVESFIDRFVQVANLVSPAQRDLDAEFPSGEYSGRTDQIMVSLLGDHADYITEGTLSAGMAMGTITFGGDKSLREIYDEFALQDHFIWSLTPTGALNYNDGTVDSVENFTATSPISNINKTYGNRAINFVDVKGGFVSGAQVIGTPAQNIPDQQANGRNPFETTFSHLDLAAQCTTTNTNVLARLGTQPLIVPFTHNDPTVGIIQCGETITFEYGLDDPNITSDQFLILDCIYDAKQGKANYRISDHVI